MNFKFTYDKQEIKRADMLIKKSDFSDDDYNQQLINKICNSEKSVAIDLRKLSKRKESLTYFVNSIKDGLEDRQEKCDKTIYVITNKKFNLSAKILNDFENENSVFMTGSFSGAYDLRVAYKTSGTLQEQFEKFDSELKEETVFRDYLLGLIDSKGYKKYSDVYKAAGVSRFTFSKITRCDNPQRPSKETVAALAIGLKLNIDEAQNFYHAAGFHLGSDFTDRIIRFFISEAIYDIDAINYFLDNNGYPVLVGKTK